MEMTFEQFMQQPGAIEFIGMLKTYTDRGMPVEEACEAVRKMWLKLLANVADGMFRDSSRLNEAAQAFKRNLAEQVWDSANSKQPQFASADALADWLDTLHEAYPDGSVGAYKWAPAQAAAKALREASAA